MGVVPFVQRLAPAGLTEIPARYELPPLGDVEFVLLSPERPAPNSAQALAAAIRMAGGHPKLA